MNTEPIKLSNVFNDELRARLLNDCDFLVRRGDTKEDPTFARLISNNGRLYGYMELLLPLVRKIFNDETILPSYLCWARYSSIESNLPKHKDDNACTFTIDYCVRQYEPWDLYVEGVPYTLEENEALAFYGEEQEHWRGPFKPGNMVEMIFFHFVRPDHWYFTD